MKAAVLLLALPLGVALGVGLYTFTYARGGAYRTNDPRACASCHIMDDYSIAGVKGSHRSGAVCNDCPTAKGLVPKYVTKASNGFWHSFAFTTQRFPEHLRIKPHNREITEKRCRSCHQAIVDAIANREPTRAEALAREHSRLARTSLAMALRDKTRLINVPGASLIRFPEAI